MSKFWPVRTTGEDESIDARLHDGRLVPQTPSSSDLLWVVDWIATYCLEDDDSELGQAFANAMGFLVRKANEMEARKALNDAKRAYAKQHNVPFRRVRATREK